MTRAQVIKALAHPEHKHAYEQAMSFVWSINQDCRAEMFVPRYKELYGIAGRVVMDRLGKNNQDEDRDKAQYLVWRFRGAKLVKPVEFFKQHPCPALPAGWQGGAR